MECVENIIQIMSKRGLGIYSDKRLCQVQHKENQSQSRRLLICENSKTSKLGTIIRISWFAITFYTHTLNTEKLYFTYTADWIPVSLFFFLDFIIVCVCSFVLFAIYTHCS